MNEVNQGGERIDSEVTERRTCRLAGCGGPASGVCINNLSFDECPDVVGPAPSNIAEDTGTLRRADADVVSVHDGQALGAIACDDLLRQRGGIVVGLVAGPEVGKTTLISTMYELLARRRMASFRFAGSETLRGYEERCHLARLASNRVKADTPRTPTKAQLSFTHLRIAKGDVRTDIVFSDRSGEHFNHVLDRPIEVAGFQELRRAEVILLLIDLKEFLAEPHVQTARMRKWIMAMAQNGLLHGKTVRLVGTKADLVTAAPNSNAASKALDELAEDLSRRSQGVRVLARRISCRPREAHTEVGEGIENLLSEILAPKELTKAMQPDIWPDKPTEIDLLMRGFRARFA